MGYIILIVIRILHIEIYNCFVNHTSVTGDLFYIICVQQIRD